MGLIIVLPPPDDGGGDGSTGVIGAYVEKPESTMNVDDTQDLYVKRLAMLTEAMEAADSIQQVLTIAIEVSDEFSGGDSLELNSQLLAELTDEIHVYGLFKILARDADGNPIEEDYATWVMNTERGQPLSEYTNYNFNSLAYYRDQLYGANDEGLYTMSGATDAGTNITAHMASMMLDFGTSRQKRLRSAYLGYTSEGQLVLKVRAVDDGQLTEHWYQAAPVDVADAPREGYVRIGQGLRSRYWQFELSNVDGGDFEIDQLELYPLFLNRRV